MQPMVLKSLTMISCVRTLGRWTQQSMSICLRTAQPKTVRTWQLGRRMRTSQAGDIWTDLSARETKITASDTAITQDLCLGISTTILRIKRLEMCMKFLFTRSKATLIPCPMLQALEYSTAHSMAFMLATARLFIRLPIAVMSQKNLFQTEIG